MSSKNVVIIGGASGGAGLARALDKALPPTHNIILIEKNDFAYWPIASLRAAVLAGAEASVFAPLDKIFPSGSRHQVWAGAEVVELGESSLKVKRSSSAEVETVEFEHAVLATGSLYAKPCRPTASTKEKALEGLRSQQKDIQAAKSILIIGAGAVGVEFAGEINDVYPKGTKKITIVGRSKQLVGDQWGAGLHRRLLSQFERAGITLALEDEIEEEGIYSIETGPVNKTFTTKKGLEIQADYVINALGGKANTSLVESADPSALEAKTNRVKVTPKLHVVPEAGVLGKNYWAIGDCNDAPGGKTLLSLGDQIPVLAANLVAAVKATEPSKAFKGPTKLISVPFGAKDGATELPIFTTGGFLTSLIKGKTLFVSRFKGIYNV